MARIIERMELHVLFKNEDDFQNVGTVFDLVPKVENGLIYRRRGDDMRFIPVSEVSMFDVRIVFKETTLEVVPNT
ncbi:hypothetical protein HV198_09060 [Citrobacter freundii]|uniref:hypothetical protein n=1 Tax=Citrobacter freundii TaxID=546 RepID=UPI0015E5816A|nr:hypothetical protein [Citrobacter freundii]QLO42288.1 hypothetical protein HV215_09060 [Citrobacter freundii]QLV40452.1 hypothetical protein HV198_09060 [Citrobacter freundii]